MSVEGIAAVVYKFKVLVYYLLIVGFSDFYSLQNRIGLIL